VNHKSRAKTIPARQPGLPGFAAAQRTALSKQLGSSNAMDRTVNTSTT
jgi:hypothetical protein